MKASNDLLTLWLLKWVVIPLLCGISLLVFGNVQINQWKCNREAKRQGYLQGMYRPRDRVGLGEKCICKEKMRPDGSIETSAKLIIDLENKGLSW